MRTFNFLILITASLISCQTPGSSHDQSLSLEQADSIIHSAGAYEMEYKEFVDFVDSIHNKVDNQDPVGKKYFFLDKKYPYNLNHSLSRFNEEIVDYSDYRTFRKKANFENEDLLHNKHFKQFVTTYLDLTAKYQIAEKGPAFSDNVFINTQLEIIENQMEGEIKNYALFKTLEAQIKTFGTKNTEDMLLSFKKDCKNADYIQTIDSLYQDKRNQLAKPRRSVYHVVDTDSLNAYINYPSESKTAHPCIILIHGGGWYIGQPTDVFNFASDFNRLGFVSVSIEHRIKGRQDATPVDGLKDAKAAIRWVRKNAEKLKIDKNQIVVGGRSSGGHLAAATALIEGYEHEGQDPEISSEPDAVVLWSPCVDPTVDNWFHYCLNGQDKVENLSPLHHISAGSVPFLIFQGKNDEFLDFESHKRFAEKMKQNNNPCKLVLFENTSHMEVYEKDLMDYYKQFIKNHL